MSKIDVLSLYTENVSFSKALQKGDLLKQFQVDIRKIPSTDSFKVFASILCSTGCRAGEVLKYRIIQITDDHVVLKIPISKRKRPSWREVSVVPSSFGLSATDYIHFEEKMRKVLYYQRRMKSYFHITRREYRKLFCVFLLQKGFTIHEVRDMLCHSNISVTDYYLRKHTIDHTKLFQL